MLQAHLFSGLLHSSLLSFESIQDFCTCGSWFEAGAQIRLVFLDHVCKSSAFSAGRSRVCSSASTRGYQQHTPDPGRSVDRRAVAPEARRAAERAGEPSTTVSGVATTPEPNGMLLAKSSRPHSSTAPGDPAPAAMTDHLHVFLWLVLMSYHRLRSETRIGPGSYNPFGFR